MDLDSLKYFLRVVELKSLTKAVPALSISQPVISRSLAQLEKRLGGRLFNRNGHGVTLTPLGESLLARAKIITRECDALIDSAHSFSNTPSGEVRLGMLPSFSTVIVSNLLERVRQELPAVKVKVFVGSTVRLDEWLNEGRINIAVNFGNGQMMGDAQTVAEADTYLVGQPGSFLFGRQSINFKELDEVPLILPATKSSLRKTIEDIAHQLGVTINPVMEVDTSALYLKLAREGYGYAITTQHALHKQGSDAGLAAVLIVNPKITRKILMGTSLRAAPSLATRRVATLLIEIATPLLRT